MTPKANRKAWVSCTYREELAAWNLIPKSVRGSTEPSKRGEDLTAKEYVESDPLDLDHLTTRQA